MPKSVTWSFGLVELERNARLLEPLSDLSPYISLHSRVWINDDQQRLLVLKLLHFDWLKVPGQVVDFSFILVTSLGLARI